MEEAACRQLSFVDHLLWLSELAASGRSTVSQYTGSGSRLFLQRQGLYIAGLPVDICRFERLEVELETRFGVTGMLHLVKSNDLDYRESYDDKGREIVADLFAEDIAEFGYSFDGTSRERPL